MRFFQRWPVYALMLCALLAGCGAVAKTAASVRATATPAATATPFVTQITTKFTCPTASNGNLKTFSDSVTGLRFSYPAYWTERECQRITSTTSTDQTLIIGNLMTILVSPRNGQSIQDYVARHQQSGEQDALTPLYVAHAAASETIRVTNDQGLQTPPTFGQTLAIIAGSQDFFVVNIQNGQTNQADTMPMEPLSALLPSFNVP